MFRIVKCWAGCGVRQWANQLEYADRQKAEFVLAILARSNPDREFDIVDTTPARLSNFQNSLS